MFKFLILILVPFLAQAQDYTTAKMNKEMKEGNSSYVLNVTYPVLKSTDVPASDQINKKLFATVSDGCGDESFEFAQEMESSISAESIVTVQELNQNYVSYKGVYDMYCGGAHPNYGVFYVTFDSQTGDEINFNKEIPMQDYELKSAGPNYYDEHEAYTMDLAKIILKNVSYKEITTNEVFNECYSGSEEEVLEQIKGFYPYISGLDVNNRVVLALYPPHVATACAFTVSVPYSDVSKHIKADSVLHKWLK